MLLARRAHRDALEGLGPVRQLLVRARLGLAVMRSPRRRRDGGVLPVPGLVLPAARGLVGDARRSTSTRPLSTAGLVLVLINVATIFPLWPGNFGLVQIAIAFPLVNYGVPYARGFAFGIGLQAIEASVGVGVGLIFLAREGLSYAMLKTIDEPEEQVEKVAGQEPERARSRVSG